MPDLSNLTMIASTAPEYPLANPINVAIMPTLTLWKVVVSDSTAPVVGSFAPAVASSITQPDFLVFETTDNIGLRRALVLVSYPDNTYAVVHDGDAFAAGFAGVSTRTAISGGYQFNVRPNNGWTAAPTLRIIATDLSGNETA